jgi:hypothetical protein
MEKYKMFQNTNQYCIAFFGGVGEKQKIHVKTGPSRDCMASFALKPRTLVR